MIDEVYKNDEAYKYAISVLNNEFLTCELTKLSCKRFINDLEKSKTDEFSYYYDVKEAKKVLKFCSLLKLATKDGKKLELAGFQKFCICNLLSWKEKSTGFRRFRESNISLGRKNGKSFFNGLLAVYLSNFTNCPFGQVYMVATKKDQARITYNEAVKFICCDEDLKDLFLIKDYKSEITALNTNCVIKALSADNKQDGLEGYLNIVDEYHLHKNPDLYNMLKNSCGKLDESLTSVISTAGSNLSYPYFKMYLYSKKILAGEECDDRMFVFICELDENDDIWDKKNYIKANPLYTESQMQTMYEEGIRAKNMSENQLTDWMTKKCNIWVQDKGTNFLTLETIEKMRSDKTISDFKDKECIIGLDLSSISDLTSVSFVFKDWINGEEEYFIHSHSFLPSETFKKFRKKEPMWQQQFLDNKELTITEACGGLRLDYKSVIQYIDKTIKEHNLKPKMLCYDSNNIGGILQDIEEVLKIDSMPIAQSMKNLTEPTVNFEILSKAGKIQFASNSLYEECLKNAILVSSYGESKLCKIDKKQVDRKIDAVDATIDAFKFALTMKPPKKRISYGFMANKMLGI